jgi:hypothetical protein
MGDPAAIGGEGLTRSKTEHSDHSSSLLNEQHQDLDTEHQAGQAPPMKRQNTPIADFAQKYGELQQHVIGKGNDDSNPDSEFLLVSDAAVPLFKRNDAIRYEHAVPIRFCLARSNRPECFLLLE